MCGRYALYGPVSRLREQFGIQSAFDAPDWYASYNIAPSQFVPVVRAARGGGRELVEAQWGLLPSWVTQPGKVVRPLNAKIETAAEKPMFRSAFRRFRILVPACGFYEWQPGPDHKQPFFIRPAGGAALFGIGGLLERHEGPDGVLHSFAILTTAANASVAPIHERMPVIVEPQDYDAWLDPEIGDPALLRELAAHYPAERIEAYPVGRAVGSPRSQGPELVEPIAPQAPASPGAATP
jgi:putative SOS response-associated peptidase YedK